MGAGAYLEPLVVISLLFGGAWINRARDVSFAPQPVRWVLKQPNDEEDFDAKNALLTPSKRSLSPSLLPSSEPQWREREIRLFGLRRTVMTPNTAVFRNRFLSRVLRKFPFLAEAWYWALIYWVYQLLRAFTAVTLVEGTVHVARRHALTLISIEQRYHIFWELPIQRYFMSYPNLMTCINWLYSFIHIPGTIAFLVWLYWYTITTNPIPEHTPRYNPDSSSGETRRGLYGAALYQARRRTMATCNLLAFVVFTVWPCMPPRLLSDPSYNGPKAELARSFGFVDTVHGEQGAGSVWTQNRFCNQYAAMPSLHFGYSLLIGLTIASIPLSPPHRRSRSIHLPFFNQSHPQLAPKIRLPSAMRMLCVTTGVLYPLSILIAIVATANHFILDAVAGAVVVAVGWNVNSVLLNLCAVEDWFLWALRIQKPKFEAERSEWRRSVDGLVGEKD